MCVRVSRGRSTCCCALLGPFQQVCMYVCVYLQREIHREIDIHTHTHTHTHTHMRTRAHTHAHTLAFSRARSLSRACALSLSLTLSLNHSLTHTHTRSLSRVPSLPLTHGSPALAANNSLAVPCLSAQGGLEGVFIAYNGSHSGGFAKRDEVYVLTVLAYL